MTERVEEIRRRHEYVHPIRAAADCDTCWFLTALAQAERTIKELDHLKNDAILRFDEIDRENEALHEQLAQAERERDAWQEDAKRYALNVDAARAEVERLKDSVKNVEIGRHLDYELWQKAEAARARVRTVIQRELGEHRASCFGPPCETCVRLEEARAALEGR